MFVRKKDEQTKRKCGQKVQEEIQMTWLVPAPLEVSKELNIATP